MMYKPWIHKNQNDRAAIVVAQTQTEAADILNKELKRVGLKPDVEIEDMKAVKMGYSHVIIINKGDTSV